MRCWNAAAVLAVSLLAAPARAGYTTDGAPEIVDKANAWKPGEAIPPELLQWRASRGDLGLASDTVPVMGSITNYPLLLELLFRADVDARIRALAASAAEGRAGPTRFFGDVLARYEAAPELLKDELHARIREAARVPHVVVDGLFIHDADMPRAERAKVFEAIKAELASGKPWGEVQRRYYDLYEHDEVVTYGKKSFKTRVTRVGNLGSFVVTPRGADARPFRYADLPASHAKALLAAKVGEVVVLVREKDLNHPKRHELFQVREVFPGRP